MRLRFVLTVILLLLLTASMQVLAQSSDCTGKAAQAQLSSTDPVYIDAMDLARKLIDRALCADLILFLHRLSFLDGISPSLSARGGESQVSTVVRTSSRADHRTARLSSPACARTPAHGPDDRVPQNEWLESALA